MEPGARSQLPAQRGAKRNGRVADVRPWKKPERPGQTSNGEDIPSVASCSGKAGARRSWKPADDDAHGGATPLGWKTGRVLEYGRGHREAIEVE